MTLTDVFDNNKTYVDEYNETAHASSSKTEEIDNIIDIGIEFLENDDKFNALKLFKLALEEYKIGGYDDGKANAYNLLGDTFLMLRIGDLALGYYDKACSVYIDLKMDDAVDIMNSKINEAKSIMAEHNISFYNLDKNQSLQILQEDDLDATLIKDLCKSAPSELQLTEDVLKTLYSKIDELVRCCNHFDDYFNPNISLNESLKKVWDTNDFEGEAILTLLAGNEFLKINDIANALDYFNRSQIASIKNRNTKGKAIAMLCRGIIFFILNERKHMYIVLKNALSILDENDYDAEKAKALSLIKLLTL